MDSPTSREPVGFRLNIDDTTSPDPGTEGDFSVDHKPFAFSPGEFSKLLSCKLHARQCCGVPRQPATALPTY